MIIADDWETAWAEQLEKKNRRERLAGNATLLKRGSSSITHSIHRYLELGVFCDKQFLEYHKGKDYEQYVLTIMNIAADYYHDVSIGNQMDLVVVRIVYLEKEKEEVGLIVIFFFFFANCINSQSFITCSLLTNPFFIPITHYLLWNGK